MTSQFLQNQNQFYQDEKRRKKELQKEVQREYPYIMEDDAAKYTIKKKKTSKCNSHEHFLVKIMFIKITPLCSQITCVEEDLCDGAEG